MTYYPYLKLLHILLAIVAVGFTSTFGIIMATAKPETLRASLGIVSLLEKITRPAFAGLVITGVWMGGIYGYGLNPLWFSGSLGLAIVAMVLAITIAAPNLRAMNALAQQTPPPVAEIQRLGGKSRVVGMTLSLLSLTMIVLMVLKPM